MPAYSRELTVLGLLGATLWLPQCSQLTKVDWSIIPPAGGASGAATGGSSGMAAGEAGELAQAGEVGKGGAAGEAGEGGSGGETEVGGNGGTFAGGGTGGTLGGTGGGGTGGSVAGNGGIAGAVIAEHPTCETAPTPPTTPPDLTHALVFFDGGGGPNGNRGPRAKLDSSCQAVKNTLGLPQATASAVISINSSDTILTMPEHFHFPRTGVRVVSPLGIQLAASWNLVFATTGIPVSLVCGGVMPPTAETWLTGTSNATFMVPGDIVGVYYGDFELSKTEIGVPGSSHACNEWTLGTDDVDVQARVGSTTSQNDPGTDGFPRFVRYRLYSCDAATDHVLCVAYDPVP